MGKVEGTMQGSEVLNDGSAHFIGGPAYMTLQSFPNFRGVKLLCALSQYSYWFMGIRSDIDIEKGDIQGLKGLRISSSRSAPGHGLRHMLREAGIDLERDNIEIVLKASPGERQRVFRGGDGIDALQQGIADAFWGNGMRLEMAVRAGIAKPHIDLRRGDGPPGARYYNFPALAATEEFIAEHPDAAAGAVRAIVKTQKALKGAPSLAAKVGREIFPDQEAEIIADLVARDAPFYDAEITQDAVYGLNKFCLASDLLTEPVSYERLVATQFRELWR